MTTRRFVLLASAGLVLAACGGAATTERAAPAPAHRDLATVLASDSDLERFVDAVNRTEADEMLRSSGVYTVFAPTDSGWGEIPASQRQALFPANAPADPVRGRALINAHVVEGRHPLSAFEGRTVRLTTQNGNRIVVDGTDPNRVTVRSERDGGYGAGAGVVAWGASTITRADIPASNGIVHVVNRPILP
jgi:uncharacterized surface protein with fasciclin (FAS1) repeats